MTENKNGFAVVQLNALTNECDILRSFQIEIDALDYLNKAVNNHKEYEDQKLYMKYIENERQISIYKRNWIFPKTLTYRYFIREYEC